MVLRDIAVGRGLQGRAVLVVYGFMSRKRSSRNVQKSIPEIPTEVMSKSVLPGKGEKIESNFMVGSMAIINMVNEQLFIVKNGQLPAHCVNSVIPMVNSILSAIIKEPG